jgi:hypothetical protein
VGSKRQRKAVAVVQAADFEEIRTVVDGAGAVVMRRRDHLQALAKVLTGEQINALRALADASEKATEGLGGRCTLDRTVTGGGGPEAAMIARVQASATCGEMWGAVPPACANTVRVVVLQRWPMRAYAVVAGGNTQKRLETIRAELREGADAINAWLDRRFGGRRVRSGWWADEPRGEVRRFQMYHADGENGLESGNGN